MEVWVNKKQRHKIKKKHKQENNKKKLSKSFHRISVLQSDYKPALLQTQAKLMRRRVDITALRYGEQLAFQRQSMFFCTESKAALPTCCHSLTDADCFQWH